MLQKGEINMTREEARLYIKGKREQIIFSAMENQQPQTLQALCDLSGRNHSSILNVINKFQKKGFCEKYAPGVYLLKFSGKTESSQVA